MCMEGMFGDVVFSAEEEEEEDPTFRRLYLKICHKLGVIPTSYFVNHIEDETVTLRHHGLSGKETRALAMALKVCYFQYRFVIVIS